MPLHSYKYLQLRKYLLDERRWQEKELLLQGCGLNQFLHIEETLELLNARLNEKYQKVNLDYKQGKNKRMHPIIPRREVVKVLVN